MGPIQLKMEAFTREVAGQWVMGASLSAHHLPTRLGSALWAEHFFGSYEAAEVFGRDEPQRFG